MCTPHITVSKQCDPTVLYTETFCFVHEVKSLVVLLCEAERWRFVHEAVLYLDRLREWLDTSLSPPCTLTPLTVPQCPKAAAPLMSTPNNLESGGGVVPDCSQQSSVCTMDTHDFH